MRSTRLPRTLIFALTWSAAAILLSGDAAAQEETVLYNFDNNSIDATYPRVGLTFDKANNLYGTSTLGGIYDGGTVYKLTHGAGGVWTESMLYSFSPKAKYGADLISGVVFDKAGNLYGTTTLGGAKNNGRVFELSPQPGGDWTGKYPYLFGQNSTDGTTPLGGVIVDNAGNLYGTTVYGGTGTCFSNGCGTVFKLSPNADGRWQEKILYNFVNNGTDGVNPYTGLTFDTAGNLYGTTNSGGAYNQGTVFQLSPSASGTWTETIVHSFGNGADPGLPRSLVFNRGNLYGSTAEGAGAGTVFELSPAVSGGWTEQILYTFISGNSDPTYPGGIVLDAAGNIYGISGGGTGLNGTVFELTPQTGGTWALNVLYNFNDLGTTGADPVGPLVLDKQGNLYGVTQYGGSKNAGLVFEVKP